MIIIKYYAKIFTISLLMVMIVLKPNLANAGSMKKHKEFLSLIKNVQIKAVAPAGPIDRSILTKLKNMDGLHFTIIDEKLHSNCLLHSGSVEVRSKSLKCSLIDSGTKRPNKGKEVIWSLRGGYGSAKLIPELIKLPKPSETKIFIGYSDVTALHLFLSQNWGWSTIHGAMLFDLDKPTHKEENFTALAKIINGEVKNLEIKDLRPINQAANSASDINGKITGGNLTLLQTSIGTDWEVQTKDKILFVEDVNLQPHELDRALTHLKQAGIFDNVKAIIFGNFSSGKSNIDESVTTKVIEEFVSQENIPCFKTNRFGHSDFNDPIVYNSNGTINKKAPESKTFTLRMDLRN